ncbi:hypothetical protein [Terriglobus aquaticus]|uniref:Uncharacterized protein n=1 Tax=Terriglobus aquaticus TaxID=940139 RepID=A0ABW9KQ12_9BACT|nr:hypothetical protein [Terriglobus aquaticus]
MFTFESKQVVFEGLLRPFSGRLVDVNVAVDTAEQADAPTRYWTLSQDAADLRDPENSPGVSMWAFLLASAQTQRLNEISIYAQRGASSKEMRLLYMNDFALTIWKQMQKGVKITGRLQRPPRTAVLSFGMPFANS